MKRENIIIGKYYQISLGAVIVILVLFGLATLLKKNISSADLEIKEAHLPEVIYGL